MYTEIKIPRYLIPLILCVGMLSSLSAHAAANEKAPDPKMEKICGIPVVQGANTLVINGKKVTLWGLEALAPDQQCWQGGMAWGCGENASTALKHYVDGQMVECVPQIVPTDKSPIIAKCYRFKGQDRHPRDIASHMIQHGWGMDRTENSGGAYAEEVKEAQENKVGIWSSRFQTANDWKEGVQKFVGEESEDPAVANEAEEDKDE